MQRIKSVCSVCTRPSHLLPTDEAKKKKSLLGRSLSCPPHKTYIPFLVDIVLIGETNDDKFKFHTARSSKSIGPFLIGYYMRVWFEFHVDLALVSLILLPTTRCLCPSNVTDSNSVVSLISLVFTVKFLWWERLQGKHSKELNGEKHGKAEEEKITWATLRQKVAHSQFI